MSNPCLKFCIFSTFGSREHKMIFFFLNCFKIIVFYFKMIKKSVYFYVFKGEEFKYAIKISKNQFLCMINAIHS